MNDFVVALGLVLVIEGILYSGFPGVAKRMAEQTRDLPEQTLRIAGLVAAFAGLFMVWLVRG